MDDPRTTQALRELAAMYLSSPVDVPADAQNTPSNGRDPAHHDADRPDDPDRDVQPADAELLIVGHMPGPANLWANQYAQQRARQFGREVALARIGAGRLAIDWFALDPAAAAAGDGPPAAELETVNHAALALRQRRCLWIIAITEPFDERAMPLLGRLDRWTLLSSADEAAVVAAYRLLKQWLDRYRQADPDAGEPQVELAMLGCERTEAEQAVEKIQRAASRFLTLTPRAGLHQQRMNPVHRRMLGEFALDDDALAALRDLAPLQPEAHLRLTDWQPQQTSPEPEAEASAPPRDQQRVDAGQPEPRRPAASTDDIWAEFIGETEPADNAPGRPAADRLAAELDLEPDAQPSPQAEPALQSGSARETEPHAQPAPAAGPDTEPHALNESLSDYIDGLTALRARCPAHEAVQLAVDPRGRLHLLLWDHDVDDAVRTLWETRQWAIEHARLIALTVVNPAVDAVQPPAVHLFTDAPKRYVSLAHRHALHLHALRPHPTNPKGPHLHIEIN